MVAGQEQDGLALPDRFEQLRSAGTGTMRSVIEPVEASLEAFDDRFSDLSAAGRGGFSIMLGSPGAGKSTFLDTIFFFRRELATEHLPSDLDVAEGLDALEPSAGPRLVVIDGREALGEVSRAAIEQAMHAINRFVRSPKGDKTLVVWPTNVAALADTLTDLAQQLGGRALLGDEPIHRFVGPSKDRFTAIAARTIAALNEGSSLVSLGISDLRAEELASDGGNKTIGDYLAAIRSEARRNTRRVRRLLKSEQFRMWVVVAAGNDVEGDVAALTRGGFADIDIDRLLSATDANVVTELKKHPDDLGLLGTVLDAKILYSDVFTNLAAARTYGSEKLHQKMKDLGMSTSRDNKARERIESSELGVILSGSGLGTRRRGKKPGNNTMQAFTTLATVAQNDDGLLNSAIGEALVAAGLVANFETERVLGTDLKFNSDLYLTPNIQGPIRLEIMWRKKTGRAEIANYALTKLWNYARAVKLIS